MNNVCVRSGRMSIGDLAPPSVVYVVPLGLRKMQHTWLVGLVAESTYVLERCWNCLCS